MGGICSLLVLAALDDLPLISNGRGAPRPISMLSWEFHTRISMDGCNWHYLDLVFTTGHRLTLLSPQGPFMKNVLPVAKSFHEGGNKNLLLSRKSSGGMDGLLSTARLYRQGE